RKRDRPPSRIHLPVRTSTPGNFRPERNSNAAPPPVEMWLIFDSTPACATAAAESPPPTIENAFDPATARAIANVPSAKRGFSDTPMGPFQTIVLACRTISEYLFTVSGPI